MAGIMAEEKATTPQRHYLVKSERGGNQWTPGTHTCACGATFTGINKFHVHRSEENLKLYPHRKDRRRTRRK